MFDLTVSVVHPTIAPMYSRFIYPSSFRFSLSYALSFLAYSIKAKHMSYVLPDCVLPNTLMFGMSGVIISL